MTDKEYKRKKQKLYYKENREAILQTARKKYRTSPEERERRRIYNKIYREKNREKFNEYMRNYNKKQKEQ